MKTEISWVLPISVQAIGLILQIDTAFKEFIPLPRPGALIVLLGIYLESKYVLRIVSDKAYTGTLTMVVDAPPQLKNYLAWQNNGALATYFKLT